MRIANVLHCTIHTRIAPAQIAWAKLQDQPNTVIGKTHACMVTARNAQPPTSTASDQERKTLQEKIALIQSDDEVDVAVNSAATNDAFVDSEVLRESAASNDTYTFDDSEVLCESAARNDTFDDSEVLCESEYVMYENPFQIDIRSAAEMSVENTILHAVLNAMKIQQEFSGSQEQFMRILNYGRDLYCKGDSGLQNRWPSSWQSCVLAITPKAILNYDIHIKNLTCKY